MNSNIIFVTSFICLTTIACTCILSLALIETERIRKGKK